MKIKKKKLQSLKKLNIPLHTKFLANDPDKRLESRQFWILYSLFTMGSIIDNGMIQIGNLSLIREEEDENKDNTKEDHANNINNSVITDVLDVHGITGIEDKLHEMECVNIKIGKTLANGELDPTYPLKIVERAMVNYTSDEIEKIKGLTEDQEIEDILCGGKVNSLPIKRISSHNNN